MAEPGNADADDDTIEVLQNQLEVEIGNLKLKAEIGQSTARDLRREVTSLQRELIGKELGSNNQLNDQIVRLADAPIRSMRRMAYSNCRALAMLYRREWSTSVSIPYGEYLAALRAVFPGAPDQGTLWSHHVQAHVRPESATQSFTENEVVHFVDDPAYEGLQKQGVVKALHPPHEDLDNPVFDHGGMTVASPPAEDDMEEQGESQG